MHPENMDTKDQLMFLLILLIFAAEFVMLTGGLIIKIKERYFCGRRTKTYLNGEYEEIMHREYPGWEFSVTTKNIGKKALRKLCVKCIQDMSQRQLYSAGELSKTCGQYLVSVKILVTVRPSCYVENERSASYRKDTEYYTWFIFETKPLCSENFGMNGSFYADNFYPIPAAQDAVNSLGRYMSDRGGRKADMNAHISGGLKLENNVTVSYSGIRRGQWQNAVSSGLPDMIEQLCSAWGSEIRLDYSREKLTLAAWIKMSDCEMYEGHNDLAVRNSELICFAAERLTDIAEIIGKSA